MLTSAGGGPWCFRFLGWSPWSEERTTFTYLGDPKTYLYRLLFFSRKLFWSQKMRVSHFWSQKISLLDVAILDGLDDLLHPYLLGYPLKTIGNLQTFVQQPRLSRLRLEHVHTWNTCIPPTCNEKNPMDIYGYSTKRKCTSVSIVPSPQKNRKVIYHYIIYHYFVWICAKHGVCSSVDWY